MKRSPPQEKLAAHKQEANHNDIDDDRKYLVE
jgi:hypothetical protein